MRPLLRAVATTLAASAVVGCFVAGAALVAPGSALAHEGEIGQGGPFSVRIDSPETLPAGIDARWGNGEVEFHVPVGVEMIGYGAEGEEMVKLDADGNMFANTLSPTWRLNASATMTGVDLSGTDAKGDAQWEWKQAGGSLMYHEHRIHFMAASVDPAIADGGDVSAFTLAFTVNGERLEIDGALVFDPALDPDAAAALVAAGTTTDATGAGHDAATGMGHDGAHGEEHDRGSGSSALLPVLAGSAVVALIAAGAAAKRRRR